ncbi:hypothetical protein UA08_08054 [Talaromyces atroroseus]|uniref:Zn(2)-C6 fungal-type domain-containing protein n=1 Tax=Talaromyces atroroseus TaxID=1441469 RepID=A0A225A8W4_TALAT|nr:hypothetical protein UA08_08054 [Talaromyces atroroseus]OKL56410.1 hypothetical protein UA08_08054 [Talaromyces atroroseus]
MAGTTPISIFGPDHYRTLTPRRRRNRQTFSCLPCREHKVKCNRAIPCQSCERNGREFECLVNPPLYRGGQPSRHRQRHPVLLSAVIASSENAVPLAQRNPEDAGLDMNYDCQVHDQHDQGNADHVDSGLGSASNNGVWDDVDCLWDWGALSNQVLRANTFTDIRPSLPCVVPTSGLQHEQPQSSSTTGRISSLLFEEPDECDWRRRLIDTLPTRSQCDFLTSYFFENINYVYQVLHAPSFRQQYTEYSAAKWKDVDFAWLSLLYSMLSLSILYIPPDLCIFLGFEEAEVKLLPRSWHLASRQCFCLGQAVRAAQALGLDVDSSPSTSLEQEMRHRIWWELCSSDTFQAMCLNRQPMIQSHISRVPIPLNCNDEDMTTTRISPRDMGEPTIAAFSVIRARVTRLLNKLYINNGNGLSSLEYVASIDRELCKILNRLPWYLRINKDGVRAVPQLPTEYAVIPWQHHLFHTFVCVQRIRMYICFLGDSNPKASSAQSICLESAMDAFSVYRSIKKQQSDSLIMTHQRFATESYQIFSTGVALALFLLMGRLPDPHFQLRGDVEMVISELEALETRGISVPTSVNGSRLLRKMLDIYDYNSNKHHHHNRNENGSADPTLVHGISSVIGGETRTRQYLQRCTIDYIMNSSSSSDDSENSWYTPQDSLSSVGETSGLINTRKQYSHANDYTGSSLHILGQPSMSSFPIEELGI